MEQTQYTTWEVIKMLRAIPFEQLQGSFGRSLEGIMAKVPVKDLILFC